MKLRLDKPWLDLTAENVARLSGQLGVFQIADAAGTVVYIGYAGGKSLFGLRSEIGKFAGSPRAGAARFRYEVNQQYQTRYRELLMLHVSDHGAVPELNRDDHIRLGRIG